MPSTPLIPREWSVYTTCIPRPNVNTSKANQHCAVRIPVGTAGIGDLSGKPTVALARGNALDLVYGEFLFIDGGEAVIQTGGIILLRSTVVYVAAHNGYGVISTTSIGQVRASTTLGTGFGKIIGGGKVNIEPADEIIDVFVIDADFNQRS